MTCTTAPMAASWQCPSFTWATTDPFLSVSVWDVTAPDKLLRRIDLPPPTALRFEDRQSLRRPQPRRQPALRRRDRPPIGDGLPGGHRPTAAVRPSCPVTASRSTPTAACSRWPPATRSSCSTPRRSPNAAACGATRTRLRGSGSLMTAPSSPRLPTIAPPSSGTVATGNRQEQLGGHATSVVGSRVQPRRRHAVHRVPGVARLGPGRRPPPHRTPRHRRARLRSRGRSARGIRWIAHPAATPSPTSSRRPKGTESAHYRPMARPDHGQSRRTYRRRPRPRSRARLATGRTPLRHRRVQTALCGCGTGRPVSWSQSAG